MNPFIRGFNDELVKTADMHAFARRLVNSPELRSAIKRSAVLGAVTGGISGAMQHKAPEDSRLKQILGASLVGGAGGAITGAVFPGWFGRQSMRAADEI